jgi:protein-S-isoprenylcysteine O-methyltransferase Ste14
MARRDFLSRHQFKHNAIRKDLLFFAFPAIVVFFAGLVVSGWDGYDGLVETIWDLVMGSRNLEELSTPNIIGLLLFITGLTIALVAVGTLKRFYLSTLVIREGHRLISHGIYRYMRHPIYFGVIMMCFGAPVYAPSLYGFFVMSALIPLFLIRIRIEEAMLIEEFGDAYRSYKEETKKLIPFVY